MTDRGDEREDDRVLGHRLAFLTIDVGSNGARPFLGLDGCLPEAHDP